MPLCPAENRLMKPTLVCLLLILAGVCPSGMAPVRAETISSRNPFRSYNVSGVNYGSQQWEKSNRARQQNSPPSSYRIRIRRR